MSPDLPPATRLEELLERAASHLISRDEFEQAVRAAPLHALMPASVEGKEAAESPAVELVTWSGENGAVVPIFTSESRVREATRGRSEEYEVIEVLGSDLFQVLAQTGLPVALNPNCGHGKLFTVAEAARLGSASESGDGQRVSP